MAPRKAAEIVTTVSTDERLQGFAKRAFNACLVKAHTPKEVAALKAAGKEKDILNDADAFKRTSDNVQKLLSMVRAEREAAKPGGRQRREATEIISESIGKTMGDLNGITVMLTVGGSKDNPVQERVSFSALKRMSETPSHPYHAAATDYLSENGLRFVERSSRSGQKGKPSTVLERAPAAEEHREAA